MMKIMLPANEQVGSSLASHTCTEYFHGSDGSQLITQNMPEDSIQHINFDELNQKAISQPLIKHIYTADPSAHVFNGKIYIYPSHDIDAGEAFDDLGSHFAMEDYHVISMDSPTSEAKDNGVALH